VPPSWRDYIETQYKAPQYNNKECGCDWGIQTPAGRMPSGPLLALTLAFLTFPKDRGVTSPGGLSQLGGLLVPGFSRGLAVPGPRKAKTFEGDGECGNCRIHRSRFVP